MLRAGFGPASPARKAGILDRAILPERGSTSNLLFHSNKPYPLYSFRTAFRQFSSGVNMVSALFRVGA